MSALSIQPTYPIFTDIDGQPLEDGYVWIGTANLDPQTNPITVYWDAALTIPAAQPIRTLAGYPANSGTPARLYVNSDYSIRVMNKNGSTVYSAPQATERYSSVVVSSIDASNVLFQQAGTGAVQIDLQARGELVVYDADFGSIQEAIDYCLSFGGPAPVLEITQTHTITPGNPLIINRPTSIPSQSRGKFTIRGRGAQTGFVMYGAGYMFENTLPGYSENIVFDNIWFQSDHSDNGGSGYAGVIKGEDFIRVSFNDCYFQEIGIVPYCSIYLQSYYLNHCKFVSWNGPIMDCSAFYDLSVIGCQFESGSYPGSKGFSAYDGTWTTSTQKAAFISNLYEFSVGPFVTLQNARGVVVSGNYFENISDQVLDFQQGTPKGVFVTGNSFDTAGKPATYAPILVSSPNGFFGAGNWSSTRLYTFLNEMSFGANAQGGSFGQGDIAGGNELLSSTTPITTSTRIPSKMQVFRQASEDQGVELIGDGGGAGNSLDSVNTGSSMFLPLALRQRNNSTTRNNVAVKGDGTVAINVSSSGVTLDENLTLAFFQSSPTTVRIVLRASDGVTRTADITVA